MRNIARPPGGRPANHSQYIYRSSRLGTEGAVDWFSSRRDGEFAESGRGPWRAERDTMPNDEEEAGIDAGSGAAGAAFAGADDRFAVPAGSEGNGETSPVADPEPGENEPTSRMAEEDGSGVQTAEGKDDEDDDDSPVADDFDAEGEALPELPLVSVVEALLFASREPMKPTQLARAAGKGVRQSTVREAVRQLNLQYLESSRAFEIAEIAGRFQLMSRPEFASHIRRIYPRRETEDKAARLTPTALDTLSIIAYKQPVTRSEIERIRGVGCGPVLRALIERGTVRVTGKRADLIGQPWTYGTTDAFLIEFGLGSLDELPLRNEFLNAFPADAARAEADGMDAGGEA